MVYWKIITRSLTFLFRKLLSSIKAVLCELVIGRDQNLREMIVNVNSRLTIFENCEIRECQFSLCFVILSGKFANFCVIWREIAKITGIGRERDLKI